MAQSCRGLGRKHGLARGARAAGGPDPDSAMKKDVFKAHARAQAPRGAPRPARAPPSCAEVRVAGGGFAMISRHEGLDLGRSEL